MVSCCQFPPETAHCIWAAADEANAGEGSCYSLPLLVLILVLVSGACFGQIRAGAARRVITPDLVRHAPIYLAGFDNNRVATGVHDDLFARCLALAAGQPPLVICGVDSIGLFLEDVERIRAGVRERTGGEVNVIVAATHNHQTPDTMGLWGPKPGMSGINEEYNRFVVERTAEAAVEAVSSMRPAMIVAATKKSAELAGFLNDTRPPVVLDPDLMVLSAKGRDGRAIGTLVNWANHPEALGAKNTLITADYLASFYARLEELGGGVAVFVNGAIGGMQSPLGAKVIDPETGRAAPENSFRMAEIIGRRVAELAFEVARGAKTAAIDRIEFREKRIEVPVANLGYRMAAKADVFKGRKPMNANWTTSTLVGFVRMSHGRRPLLEIALVPGELYPELSRGGVRRYSGADYPGAPIEPAIKGMMKAPHRMLFGLANDEIGYIIPKAEWDKKAPFLQNSQKRWYGEINSTGPEAAPLIIGTIRELAGLQ